MVLFTSGRSTGDRESWGGCPALGPDETLGESATTGAELQYEVNVEAEPDEAVMFWRLGMGKLGTDRRDRCHRCNKEEDEEERLGVRELRELGTGVSPVVLVGPALGPV